MAVRLTNLPFPDVDRNIRRRHSGGLLDGFQGKERNRYWHSSCIYNLLAVSTAHFTFRTRNPS